MARLLIVDDEADVREFAANFFRKRKIEVLTATDGQEALQIIESQSPSLILLDIKMQGLDGIETLRRIREKNKDVKVIMVSGKNSEEDMQKCKSYGALNYIHKPLILEELEKVVLSELQG